MTTIDLTQSKILIPLLRNMVVGLTQLDPANNAIKQRVRNIRQFISGRKGVSGEGLIGVIDRAKALSGGYDLQPHDGFTPGNYVSALPGVFYNARNETVRLVQLQQQQQPQPEEETGAVALGTLANSFLTKVSRL